MKYDHIDSFIHRIIKPYRMKILFFFSFTLLFAGLLAFKPYFIKIIVDIFTERERDCLQISILLASYVVMVLILNARETVNAFLYALIFPPLKCSFALAMFQYSIKHNYSYFQNNAIGKISDAVIGGMMDSVERVMNLLSKITVKACTIVCSILMLTQVNLVFGIISFVYSVMYRFT